MRRSEDEPVYDQDMRDFLCFSKTFARELLPLTEEAWKDGEYGTAAAGLVVSAFFIGGGLAFDLAAIPVRATYLGFDKVIKVGNRIGRARKNP